MSALRRFVLRALALFLSRRTDGELDREMAAHLAIMEDEYRAHGMSAPGAHRAARLALGGVAQAKELHRDARSFRWLNDLQQDLRLAARSMRRAPGFAAAAIVMLGLGTGSNAAIFSVVDGVLGHSPFPESDRLVLVYEATPRESAAIPVDHLERIRALPVFSAVGVLSGGSAIVAGIGVPHRQSLECVTAGMFKALGTRAQIGRVLSDDDDRPGSEPVVVLSDAVWRRDLGSDPSAVGRVVRFNGHPTRVVGVMPPRFLGPYNRNSSEMWAPLGPALGGSSPIGCRSSALVNVFARLNSDIRLSAAQAGVGNAIADLNDEGGRKGAKLVLVGLNDKTFNDVRGPLVALLGAVICVLMIACSNVANLQMERIVGRRREINLRLALGASRSRVVRQVLAENLLICMCGSAAGLLLAWTGLPAIISLIPAYVPHAAEIQFRTDALLAVLAVAMTTSLAIGVIPAARASSTRLMDELKTGSRGLTHIERWPRRMLVVCQLAFATALLVGAGLTVQTFLTLRPTAPGFDSLHKVIATVRLDSELADADQTRLFFERVLQRLRVFPGVQSVSGTTYLPMSGSVSTANVVVGDVQRNVWLSRMTDGYLRDVNIPVVEGRPFGSTDDSRAAAVAIVNERTARTLWPGRSAVGQNLTLLGPRNSRTVRQVVGVSRDTRSLGANLDVQLEVYVPYPQDPVPAMHIVTTTGAVTRAALGRAVREAVESERPGQIVDRIISFDEIVNRSVSTSRFGAWLFGAFGVLAVTLATLGLAAVVAWWVAQRTREIGVRVALGASTRSIVWMVLRQGLSQASLGVVLGIALAAASTKLLEGWLYGVAALDLRTLACGVVGMLSIAALACYVPARRAARIDPIVTLRAD